MDGLMKMQDDSSGGGSRAVQLRVRVPSEFAGVI